MNKILTLYNFIKGQKPHNGFRQSEAFNLIKKYFEYQLSMTDATSVILMERFNIKTILSLDSDFKKIGVNSLP